MLIGNKKGALQEYLWAMAPTVIAKRIYCQELIVKAFQFFATSRSLFNRPQIDCQLQCLKSIIRITSKVSTLNETSYEWCFQNGRRKPNTMSNNNR